MKNIGMGGCVAGGSILGGLFTRELDLITQMHLQANQKRLPHKGKIVLYRFSDFVVLEQATNVFIRE